MRMRGMVMAVCVLIATAIPTGAGAQVGGLIKKKVAEAAGKDEQKQTPEGDASKVYDENVLELTEPVMKGYMNGLRTELRLLADFADVMNGYKKPEEYERCRQDVATSPEGMEIMLRMANLPDNASAEEMQRAMAKAAEEVLALTKQKCGPDAGEDWPQSKRREKVAEIRAQAAAAAGAGGPGQSPIPAPPASDHGVQSPHGGPSVDDAFAPGTGFLAAARDSMTLEQYGISDERAENYCRLLESGAIHPLQPVVYPAPGGKVFWIYSEVEARAIEPHCPEILEARNKRNALFVYVYWEDPQSKR